MIAKIRIYRLPVPASSGEQKILQLINGLRRWSIELFQKAIVFSCLFIFFQGLWSQSAAPDCLNAIPVCRDVLQSGMLLGGGSDDFNGASQTGCLPDNSGIGIERHVIWLRFRAAATGHLSFVIIPENPSEDLDFAVFEAGDCGSLSDPVGATEDPSGCGISNSNTDPNDAQGLTGAGAHPGFGTRTPTFSEALFIEEGSEYLLMVNRKNAFSASAGFRLEFGGTVFDSENDPLDCSITESIIRTPTLTRICDGDVVTLESQQTNFTAFQWSRVDSENEIIPILGQTSSSMRVSEEGRYRLDAESTSGFVFSDIVDIEVLPRLNPEIRNIDISGPETEGVIEIYLGSYDGYLFQLDGGLPQPEPLFRNVAPGSHSIRIFHESGCGSASRSVVVAGLPKFFTPNGDGRNDFWNLSGIDESANPQLFVFDRYGKLLKQIGSNTEGWDGTFRGFPMPESDYWYHLIYTDAQGFRKELKGHFTLKRRASN